MTVAAFTLIKPEERKVPFLFAVPHSGREYPHDMRRRTRLPDPALRSSEDCYVDQLFSFLPSLGAPFLVANYARAYVDLNRASDELDQGLFDWTDAEPNHSFRRTHRVRAGLGVVPRFVANSQAIYDTLLDPSEIDHRLNTIYHPYHQALVDELDAIKAEFGYAILLDCHSMPAPEAMLGFKRSGPDVVLGDSWGTTSDRTLTTRLESLFRQQGYSVRRNLPYAGGYATTYYGKPHHQIHALQIELSRSLYMNERTLEKLNSFERLSNDLKTIMSTLLSTVSLTALAAE